ncbi:MAG TPA: glycosyltransferase family 4 protein, partial [Pseudidiomarina sp.]|nr:glycosyltransferase family 4 protein [Pseudidiomarina sp.]
MLHIVATQVKHGRGGISTALVGFTESPQLQAHGFNIIESHGSGGRWQAFRRAVRQIRTDVKPGDTVWLHCGPWLSMLRKGYLARVAKRQGAQVLIHLHSPRTENLLNAWWGRCLLRWLLKPADQVIVLTSWWQQRLEHALPQLQKPLTVIPNPLGKQFEKLAAEPLQNHSTATVTILTMARLVPEKGVADVIRAMPSLPEAYRLIVAGDGPQRSELEQLSEQLTCSDRVTFVG